MTKEKAEELVELIDEIAIERSYRPGDDAWTHHNLEKAKAKLVALLTTEVECP